MSQIDELKKNINDLTEKIIKIKETQYGPTIDISKHYLTDRQVAKKMLIIGAGATPPIASVPGIATPRITPETAHLIVYGKLEYDVDGNLLDDEVKYPDCVDHTVAMPDTHPLKDKIKNMKKEAKNAVRLFKTKVMDLSAEFVQQGIEIGVAAAALADAILPPSPKPAVAASLLMSLMSSIMNLLSKIAELIPILDPLLFIEFLVPVAMLDTILSAINAIFITINTTLSGVNTLLDGLTSVKKLIP